MRIKKGFLFIVFSILTLSSCGLLPINGRNSEDSSDSSSFNDNLNNDSQVHEHTFASSWSYDDNYHWHVSTCGHSVTSNKEEHTFSEIVTPPTFSQEGYTTYRCTVCGYSYRGNQIKKLDHNYDQTWSFDDSGHWHQCIDEGYEDLKSEFIPHEYDEQIIAPTYDARGYTVFTCKTCGYSYTGNETARLRHNYASEWSNDEYRHWHQCIDEGYEDLKINDANHSYAVSEVLDATYDAPGYIISRCTECGYEIRTDLAALEHIYDQGYSFDETHHWHACYDQGYENLMQDYEEHVMVEKERFDSNFYSTGWVRYGCEKCSYEYSEELPIKEHQYSEEWSSDWQYHWHKCVDEGFESLYIDQESHNYGDWVIDSPATEDSDGSQHRTCSVCEYEQKQDIKLLGSLDKIKFEAMKVGDITGIYVSAISTDIEGRVVIPEYYNNEFVKGVAPHGFENCNKITSIESKIKQVSFLGESAFKGCTSLESYIPINNGLHVGVEGFKGCTSLKEISFSIYSSLSDSAFEDCTSLETVTFAWDCSNISKDVFKNCTSLKNVTLPEVGTYLCPGMFEGCTSLKEIRIPEDVTTISENAFKGCAHLQTVNIESQALKNIGACAFQGCTDLSSINIPSSLEKVGLDVFKDCPSLNKQTYGNAYYFGSANNNYLILIELVDKTNNYLHIHDDCHFVTTDETTNNTYLTEVIIGSGLNKIGDSMFAFDTNLSSITIKENIKEIGVGAFGGCSSLTSVTIPNSVTLIGDYAFYECPSLASITIPDSVTSINKYAFSRCSSLTSIVIPDSVTSIGYEAFFGCSSLTTITLPFVGGSATENQFLGYIFGASSFDNNATYVPTTLKTVVLSDKCTSIGAGAFDGCSSLTSITIPNSVTSIDAWAFRHCSSITSITIPDSVTSIGMGAFYGCSKLASINIPNNVTSIGTWAFQDCSSITSIIIPDSVTSIAIETFSYCSKPTSIIIPDSVTSISSNAFEYCHSLSKIYFKGTAEDWDNIIIHATGNDYLINATRYYYSETEPTEEGNYWHYVDGVPTIW